MESELFRTEVLQIDDTCDVVFVADLFAEDYEGGAELTTEALITSSPLKVQKVRSKDVSLTLLKNGANKYWIFGNFSGLNPQLIPSIIANLKYSIVEYDYKYCRFRSPEKHLAISKKECDCQEQLNGKLISAFFYGSNGIWWMSEAQKQKYISIFPFLAEKSNVVLSSVFDKSTLGTIKMLRESIQSSEEKRDDWVVLGSDSWIKGAEAAKKWCSENKKTANIIWNIPYKETLARLASAEGFVYLPLGMDTCPRMVIEAKLLGCKLHLNDNVQHKDEEWFATDNIESIEEYLYAAPEFFWNGIKSMMDYRPKISGYITTYNCVSQKYPFEESINSMLGFCDEVCVVDGGSVDKTHEALFDIQMKNSDKDARVRLMKDLEEQGEIRITEAIQKLNEISKVKVKFVARNWEHPRFAVFDGMQKAEARAMCTGDFCWQMDSDEVVHEDDYEKIKQLVRKVPKNVELVALPVVEYWGTKEKVRVDVNPWKWRLSRNLKTITHGIPKDHRRFDKNGELYSAGSDGCDYVYEKSFEQVPFLSFYTKEADFIRNSALNGDNQALIAYEEWLNSATDQLPGVYHYSWFNIKRKINTYKNYWSKHWTSLFDQPQEDTAENNKFFGKMWKEVTDEEISNLSKKLKEEMGGWIFHRLVNFSTPTPWMCIKKNGPKLMEGWTSKNEE
jgi:glycosyltransferase involved in cell wall biosynthesis